MTLFKVQENCGFGEILNKLNMSCLMSTFSVFNLDASLFLWLWVRADTPLQEQLLTCSSWCFFLNVCGISGYFLHVLAQDNNVDS